MNKWYSIALRGNVITIEFLPSPNRFWPPDILRSIPIDLPEVNGKQARLTGAGATWMYAHAAATLAAAKVTSIEVQTPYKPGNTDDISQCESSLISSRASALTGALLTIGLRTSPPLSNRAIQQLLQPRLAEISQLRPDQLAITGRASSEVYARAAYCGVQSGARQITCWSARDGLVVVFDRDGNQLGRSITRPAWMAEAFPKPPSPIVIGVTGDPNRGKSVFSTALDWYRDRSGTEGWKLDCDGQAPTAPWYLSLAGIAPDEQQRELRETNKRPWTDEMELHIVQQLKFARDIFPVLIADLPGGNHRAIPPQRLPPGRERMFAEVDVIILIDREDDSTENAWREELRRFGFEHRVALVLASQDPTGMASMSLFRDGELFRGTVTGLDRTKSPQELGEALAPALELAWQELLAIAVRNSGKRV